MKRYTGAILSLLLTGILTACTAKAPPEPASADLIVSAAASLTDALKEAGKAFEAEQQGGPVKFNFGSSGALQQQIEQGAPAGLFISAATAPMESLVKKGLVAQGTVRNVASNQVVLVRSTAGAGVVTAWDDLKSDKVRRIALGNPQHVPAGQYGRAVLEHLGLWTAVGPRIVQAEDVRQVLNYVESGEVEAGIIYRSDAAASRKVVVVAEAPAGSHAPVLYPMAVIKESKQAARAGAFADFLLSARGREILRKYGFGAGN